VGARKNKNGGYAAGDRKQNKKAASQPQNSKLLKLNLLTNVD
jgi:hypothetical protein